RRPLAAKVLLRIDYYANNNIGSMARELATSTYAEYSEFRKNRIFFVPIGGAGSGAQQVARHLKIIRSVPNSSVVDLLELHRKGPEEVDVVVAFDDFSGTGQTIKEWWELNETIVRTKEAEIVIGVLVLNNRARTTLEEITSQVMTVQELLTDANVLHQDCEAFTSSEKASLLALCRTTGCSEDYVRARGECGLLVAFKHGCPNNSLPILWHNRDGVWESLFQRRST
ncbi:MAG: hypothetical protein IH899_14530, partial [Planctomycetes bacterium]|nr:hypothetical protein [Planctomycetota bacterium]